MHELSISQAIADLVLEESRKREAKKVLLVELEIGELSLLNPEQLEFWLKLSFEKTLASEAELKFENIKPEVWCRKCGYSGGISLKDDPIYHLLTPVFQCPQCSSPEIEIKKGRGCRVKRIEILADEEEKAD